ncbi:uncharacterized protein LOC121389795 [Gigantopelta aegis]|uniref:uncharacterized protein LOC121389795 n=1 Tax=Gigantopelta aegis TaxID=1735272 RepID=UPI001B887CF8|nr:uncharacterized protein LOC121389795 [Gigantopelta aegis]
MSGRGNTNEKRGRIKDREAVQNGGRTNKFLSPDKPQHETTTPGLHGLHAQSSTETSGLGETMTSGFSSQESVNSGQGSTAKARDHGGYSISPEEARATREKVNSRSRDRVNGTASGMKSDHKKHGESTGSSHHHHHQQQHQQQQHNHHHNNNNNNNSGGSGSKHVGDVSNNYDQLFTRDRRNSLSPCVGLHVENIDDEWDKRSYEEWERHSSKGRRNSARSSQGGSLKSKSSRRGSLFFGIGGESAWMKWSRERRASFQRRIEMLANAEKAKQRTSTPVKKARQEGLKFMHPDLEAKYLSEDDINELRRHQQEKFRTYKVIEKGKKQHKDPFKSEVKLTLNQWHVLNDFWDHDVFVRLRWLGLFMSLLTLVFLAVSITNTYWLTYETGTRSDMDRRVVFEGVMDRGVVFEGVMDRGVVFEGVMDRGVVFEGVMDRGVVFEGVMDRGVVFEGVMGRGVVFEGVMDRGVVFEGVMDRGIVFEGVMDRGVVFEGMMGRGVVFEGVMDRGVVFEGVMDRCVVFEGVMDRGVVFEGVMDRGIVFEGVMDRGVAFEGVMDRGVTFELVRDRGVAFEGVMDTGVVFEGVMDRGVVFEGVMDRGVVFEGMMGKDAMFEGETDFLGLKMKNFLKFKTGQNSSDLRKFGEDYYLREAKLWRPFRLFGVFATISAMAFILTAIMNAHWLAGKGFSAGIWANCYQNLSDPEAVALCPEKKPHWQNAVIGLMLFAATFGFVASMLSICGVCTSPLPRKIYYFHSAGEIFLVCALSTGVALIIFPIAIELDGQILSHRYGIGYGLGWGGAFFFLAAAVCMTLDELVRESARTRCFRWCWKGKESNRTELRQV